MRFIEEFNKLGKIHFRSLGESLLIAGIGYFLITAFYRIAREDTLKKHSRYGFLLSQYKVSFAKAYFNVAISSIVSPLVLAAVSAAVAYADFWNVFFFVLCLAVPPTLKAVHTSLKELWDKAIDEDKDS